MVNLTDTQLKEVKTYLTTTQFKNASNACKIWVKVGVIITRVKAGKKDKTFQGKTADLVNQFLGMELTGDERTYSVRLG